MVMLYLPHTKKMLFSVSGDTESGGWPARVLVEKYFQQEAYLLWDPKSASFVGGQRGTSQSLVVRWRGEFTLEGSPDGQHPPYTLLSLSAHQASPPSFPQPTVIKTRDHTPKLDMKTTQACDTYFYQRLGGGENDFERYGEPRLLGAAGTEQFGGTTFCPYLVAFLGNIEVL